jgi:hypothetical protein
MTSRRPSGEQFEQVYELNRVFLRYLQTSVRDAADLLDLPHGAKPALCAASQSLLDVVAEFPRALFRLSIDARAPGGFAREPLKTRAESLRHSVNLTILLCAWSFSRQSVYEARLLLGLESRQIAELRSRTLTDLQHLAFTPRLVVCAFPAHEWLWTELLTETRPEARRRLALIALQPGLEHEWPARRAAQLS